MYQSVRHLQALSEKSDDAFELALLLPGCVHVEHCLKSIGLLLYPLYPCRHWSTSLTELYEIWYISSWSKYLI